MIFCHIGFCGFYALKNGMNIEDSLINKIILGLLLIGGALFSVFYAVKRIIVACPKYANRNDKQRKRTSEIAIFVLTIALTVAFFLTNYTLELFAENETLRMLIYPCTFTLPFVLFFRFVAIGVMNKQVKK
jgi:glucan phosphoethanolaminetransferase (alkaline phosphatase superfamily)